MLALLRCQGSFHYDLLLAVRPECHPVPSWIYPWSWHTPSYFSPLMYQVTWKNNKIISIWSLEPEFSDSLKKQESQIHRHYTASLIEYMFDIHFSRRIVGFAFWKICHYWGNQNLPSFWIKRAAEVFFECLLRGFTTHWCFCFRFEYGTKNYVRIHRTRMTNACRPFWAKAKLPCNEENLAFLAILISDKVKIKDSIATFISRQRRGEVLISFIRASKFLHHYFLILNLENNKPVVPLRF